MPYLLRIQLADLPETRELADRHLLIGRGANSQLRLDDGAVALEHAWIRKENGSYVLIDQGSVTGTYVNGKRTDTVRLADGDRVTIGPFLLNVRFSGKIDEPLVLDVTRTAAAADKRQPEIKHRSIDFVAAYALDRGFFKKTTLALFFTLGGLVILAGILSAGRTHVFRPGGLSDAHALFRDDCARCHVPWNGPSDKACAECHAGPLHHENQIFTASCTSCHPEHQGRKSLASVRDQDCIQCHADLKMKGTEQSRFTTKITDFAHDHPEFAIRVKAEADEQRLRLNDIKARHSDSAKIKLNHELHLKPELKSPRGSIQLVCEDCHKPAIDGRRMQAVVYEAHCKECHRLGFDDQFPDREVPHGSPELVRAYLIRVYGELQEEMAPHAERARKLPGVTLPSRLTASVVLKVEEAEAHLAEVTCKECHELSYKKGRLFEVEKPNIPMVWHRQARFSHKAHRMLGCVSCHADVFKSRETSDVLLPGIATCRTCHRKTTRDALFQKASAPTNCVACHTYHDKSKDRTWNGAFTVKSPFLLEKVKR